MASRLSRWAFPALPAADADTWELQPGTADAERLKRERLIRLNTVVVPRLRAIGFALLLAGALLHNELLLGEPSWTAWGRLALGGGGSWAVSTYMLYLF